MSVANIPESFLWCRDVLHSWDPYSASVGKAGRLREVHQVLLCVRCGTFKTRFMTPAGIIRRTSYRYPPGYLLAEQGRMSPADRATVRRINLKNKHHYDRGR